MGATIPVIDLFSGPGGLSEGFSRFGERDWEPELARPIAPVSWEPPRSVRFRIALSIEKDATAHQTLRLRSFFRQFEGGVPESYYEFLRGNITRDELFARHPDEAAASDHEAWCATLGEVDEGELDRRIRTALSGASIWCLIGGPPCQAYSLVGRSRNKGVEGYRAEEDHRHFLYREYLRIVAHHEPPVFVMENVKGLLSSTVNGGPIFDRIVEDLSAPGKAIAGADESLRYDLIPFAVPEESLPDDDGRRFILRSEKLGIPQARHRVILFGIRNDLTTSVLGRIPQLPIRSPVFLKDVFDDLPHVRGSVSRVPAEDEGETWLQTVRGCVDQRWFRTLERIPMDDVADKIRRATLKLRMPRARRGGQFVEADSRPTYAPGWFHDPRIGGVCNHESRSHMAKDLERYFFAACFAAVRGHSPDLADFPPSLLPEHQNAREAARDGALFSDRFRVQLRNRAATTVTSHISKDGHYYIHPDPLQCRALTVREAARLQTFPDNYFFCGPRTQQFHQVGNAVPPLLAVQLAGAVATVLNDAVNPTTLSRPG